MGTRLWRCAVGAGLLALAGPVLAQASCVVPTHDGHPLSARQERIEQFQGMGEQCLKQLMVECNDSANRMLLDTASAFTCSLGYEALLRGSFRGDFQAMLAWWREHREPQAK
jgi:hypothetical protein